MRPRPRAGALLTPQCGFFRVRAARPCLKFIRSAGLSMTLPTRQARVRQGCRRLKLGGATLRRSTSLREGVCRTDGAVSSKPPSLAALDLYCDRVASAVGRLSTRAFGMPAREGDALAHQLGRAFQLTNILRDLDEDAAMGRLYL